MNYKIKPVFGRDPFSGMPTRVEAWLVIDFQDIVVARCDAEHNASLICKLLNQHT